MGWRRVCQVLTLAGVVPDPPGVEEAAMGCYRLLRWNGGTPTPLDLPLVRTQKFSEKGKAPPPLIEN